MHTSHTILGVITDYLTATGISKTRFGKMVVNDQKLVFELEEGRDLRLGTVHRILSFIDANPPAQEIQP
ncbi:hypothetical protein CU669_15180 [Paramagnetospirillum kuznetsovii]|uniref:Uncharacterized protein n=1 Tax=Paramagnetospirillum kuznetsovii TaxID=2053833 RepID=A0A364NW15_9PROT|nr:hypothetical protein [Paramagnetospirillum kuznetsovii]RAU21095.1 hypothetical protein CU669_15180 [Paramagnetospirillum kuznetsovii]